jgi:hypothetical protein
MMPQDRRGQHDCYNGAMPGPGKGTAYRVVRPARPGRALVLAPDEGVAAETYVFADCDAGEIPDRLHGLLVEEAGAGGERTRWELACDEGRFTLAGRGLEVLVPEPLLFDELLAPFGLRERDRTVVGWLLGLLRLPGGAWLLRAWHTRRR